MIFKIAFTIAVIVTVLMVGVVLGGRDGSIGD